MKIGSLFSVLFTLLAACGSIAKAAITVIGPDTLLLQEKDASHLPYFDTSKSNLQSSYDRMGGNGDCGNYLSTSGGVGVLADMDGPGAIVRIWSANPSGRLKIYIDGNPKPVVDVDFPKLFDNSTPPFAAPLALESSGGYVSYLPITYAKHCRVTLDNAPNLYYQVNYLTFAPRTAVRSFSLPLRDSDRAALATVGTAWSSLTPIAALPGLTNRRRLSAGASLPLGSYQGPGLIQKIRLALPSASDGDLRRLVLRAYFDGHATPDIEAPVADFFGNAYGRKPMNTLLLTTAADGSFEAKFPMPFARSARFTLTNDLDRPMPVAWSADIVHTPFDPNTEGYFHAIWRQEMTVSGRPHIWARVKGQRGKFVGVVQTMSGHGLGFLEGDEQFRVDNQAWAPAPIGNQTVIAPWNGTGTEDCFNCGWYFISGPVTLPTHGVQVRRNTGAVNCFRWFLLDAPTFQSSMDAQIEHGGSNDAANTYYSSVAYWYSSGPVQTWASFPRASELSVPPPHIPAVVPHLIEGESLIGTAKASSGNLSVQDMANWGMGWSNDSQLFWEARAENSTLTLTVTPPSAGAFDLVAYVTKARDYGSVVFTVNGKPAGAKLDCYSPGVQPSGPVDLGVVVLPAGPSTIVVRVMGKNSASLNYNFGLDAISLNKPGATPAQGTTSAQ